MSSAQHPLSCADFDSQLSDYLEGALLPADRATMDAHVQQCEACAALMHDLQAIISEAASLPLLTPSRDLWPEIESRLGTPVTSLTERAVRVASARTMRTFSLWQFAAAALVLVTASSGATYLVARGSREPVANISSATPARGDASAAGARLASSADTNANHAARLVSSKGLSADVIYEHEIRAMRSVVDQRLSELDPKTVVVIQRNLVIIDKAIEDSRAALAKDPHSGFLSSQLDRALETKLSTMRKVALL